MARKFLAVIAIVIVAVFASPMAANAAGYVPAGNITVTGNATPGGTVVVSFANGSFTGGEDVSFSVTGEGGATLSALRAAVSTVTLVKPANASGAVSVNVKLPANASGSYTLTATGLTSTNIGTATITVVAADGGTTAIPGRGLAATGAGDLTVLLLWGGAGMLLLGAALLVVLSFVRRQRANA